MWEIKEELRAIRATASSVTSPLSGIENTLNSIELTLSRIEGTLSTIESNHDIWIKGALEDIQRTLGDIGNSLDEIGLDRRMNAEGETPQEQAVSWLGNICLSSSS